jgi:zinc D-Ala-D-Ala carboxypeptidase
MAFFSITQFYLIIFLKKFVKVGNTLKKMLWVVFMMSLILCVSVFGLSSFTNYNFLPDTHKKPAEKPDQTVDSIKPGAPDSSHVLVNKQNTLPEDFAPVDLIDPSIPFIFNEKSEKRKMSAEAAGAIERLFTAAKKQGVELLGVSGYRSHESQTALFNHYVEKDGYEKAVTYSAPPRTSEHQTGLAIDVTGGDGKCAAEECFAGTIEAKWLEENAAQFGFIIRYPKGKEAITGYQYEPWHLRYVGTEIAKNITNRGITLEEYYNAIPVNN